MKNKNIKMEMVDILDESLNIIGNVSRTEAHKKELLHAVADCYVFNEKGQVLIQKQSKKKHPNNKNKWSYSCGGHIHSGEKVEDAMQREFFEELGIKAGDLFFVDKYQSAFTESNHMIYIFISFINSSTKFTLDPDEVESVEWVEIEDVLDLTEKTGIESSKGFKLQLLKILKYFVISKEK
jgi:isopentenyl-diphosphate delta-isomerase type 1